MLYFIYLRKDDSLVATFHTCEYDCSFIDYFNQYFDDSTHFWTKLSLNKDYFIPGDILEFTVIESSKV